MVLDMESWMRYPMLDKERRLARDFLRAVKEGLDPFQPGRISLEVLNDWDFRDYIIKVYFPHNPSLTCEHRVHSDDLMSYGEHLVYATDLGKKICDELRYRVMTEREPNLVIGEN